MNTLDLTWNDPYSGTRIHYSIPKPYQYVYQVTLRNQGRDTQYSQPTSSILINMTEEITLWDGNSMVWASVE